MRGRNPFARRNPVHEMWDYLRTECYRRCIDYDDYLRLCVYGKKEMEDIGIGKFPTQEDVTTLGSYLIEDLERIRWRMRGAYR